MTTKNSGYRQYRSRSVNPDEQVQLQWRTDTKVRQRLQAEADRRQMSVNYLIEQAVVTALDQWEREKLHRKP